MALASVIGVSTVLENRPGGKDERVTFGNWRLRTWRGKLSEV